MSVEYRIKIKKYFYISTSTLLIVVGGSCMTDKQSCYSHASDRFKECMFRFQFLKTVSSEDIGDYDLLYTSCSSYVRKELSCPDEDSVIPINPKR